MRENARRDRVYGVPNPDGSDCSPSYADDPVRLKKWGLEGKSKEEVISLGDQHPAFRYIIWTTRTSQTQMTVFGQLGIDVSKFVYVMFGVVGYHIRDSLSQGETMRLLISYSCNQI
jgi:hypothetical protein